MERPLYFCIRERLEILNKLFYNSFDSNSTHTVNKKGLIEHPTEYIDYRIMGDFFELFSLISEEQRDIVRKSDKIKDLCREYHKKFTEKKVRIIFPLAKGEKEPFCPSEQLEKLLIDIIKAKPILNKD